MWYNIPQIDIFNIKEMNTGMGKFSKPRGGSTEKPELDLDLDLDLNLDEEFQQTAEPTRSPLDSYNTPQYGGAAPKQAPKNKKRKALLITLCSVALVLLLVVIGSLWFIMSGGLDDGLILPNVTVAGVDLGGKTPEEASALLHQATDLTYSQEIMAVELPDTIVTLAPADTGAQLDVAAVIEAAYNYGRDGSWSENRATREAAATTEHPIALLPYLTLNTAYIRGVLDDYCNNFNSEFSPSSIEVEGEMPILDTTNEAFNPEAPGQSLTLNLGTPGRYVDPEKLYNKVLDAYSFNNFVVTVNMEQEETIPDGLDLQEIYDTYYHEAVDAAMDMETFEVSHEVYGYGFDLEAAQLQMEQAQYGDTITIQCQLIKPTNTKAELEAVLFRDTLASYETKHTNNKNRNNNLTLACAAINGLVLQPGDEFDYNTVVGKRTSEKGYKAADAYDGGKTVQTLGGGICQVSSTLYYCTLIADLEIVNRTEHSYVSSYMPLGMDATVSWGGPEFTFKNNTNYPIRIEAEVSDGYVKVKLIGTDEKDYYVKMEYETLGYSTATTVYEEYAPNNKEGYKDGQVIQTAYNGCTVQTYKCKYDKETNELISREEEAKSKYKKRDRIIAKIVTPATEAPAETPVETPTETPAEAPAEGA